MTGAIFRLQDNTGKSYQTFASTQELIAWNQAAVASAGVDGNTQMQLMQQVHSSVGTLQLLTPNIQLLKGDQWTGYLVFNLGSTRYADLMNGIERFTLRMAEIPVETDAAGNTTRTTEFTFVVDKTMTQLDVTCPGTVKEPSWLAGCARM